MTKYEIVIPTLNSAKYLVHTIRTCLFQKHDLSILISDNCSDDDTRKVCDAFGDERIRYIRSPRRLSMSDNWNFALEHVRGEIITFLGSDDALLPNTIDFVDRLFRDKHISAVHGIAATYYYPGCGTNRDGLARVADVTGVYHIRESFAELKRVAKFDHWYGNLPVLYHGFVSAKVIKKAKERLGGTLFRKAYPDVYSDIALSALDITYVYTDDPLTVAGTSPRSNGHSFKTRDGNVIKDAFIAATLREMPHNYDITSVNSHLLECLEDVSSTWPCNLEIDYRRWYRNALRDRVTNAMLDPTVIKRTIAKVMAQSGKGSVTWLDHMKFSIPLYFEKHVGALRRRISPIARRYVPIKIRQIERETTCDNVHDAAIWVHRQVQSLCLHKAYGFW